VCRTPGTAVSGTAPSEPTTADWEYIFVAIEDHSHIALTQTYQTKAYQCDGLRPDRDTPLLDLQIVTDNR